MLQLDVAEAEAEVEALEELVEGAGGAEPKLRSAGTSWLGDAGSRIGAGFPTPVRKQSQLTQVLLPEEDKVLRRMGRVLPPRHLSRGSAGTASQFAATMLGRARYLGHPESLQPIRLAMRLLLLGGRSRSLLIESRLCFRR